MKRYSALFSKLIEWQNLILAAKRAKVGKSSRVATQRFEFYREYELLRLQQQLQTRTYRPGPFVTHWIDKPKRRLISAAPYRDRVLHHAIINVLEPILENHFHPHSFACRKGKGSHAASQHLQRLLRAYRYTIQFDIRKFFPAIDHELLKERFRRLIKDRPFLTVLDSIVDASNPQESIIQYYAHDNLFTPIERPRGLPIGNLTSQWFANWYLDALDHWLTSHLRCGGYARYCDDFVVCDNDKGKLRDLCHLVPEFLATWRLSIHCERLQVLPSSMGRLFVGYRTYPTHRLISAQNKRQFLRRLRWMKRAFTRGQISADIVHQRLMSWLGHAGQADSLPLIRKLAEDWVFLDGRFHHFRSSD